MGWCVSIREIPMMCGSCDELGCAWEGTITSDEAVAKAEVEAHVAWHKREWAELNARWDAG